MAKLDQEDSVDQPTPPPKRERFTLIPLWVGVVVAALAIAWFFVTQRVIMSTTLPTEPLVQEAHDFLPRAQFSELKSCLQQHPLLMAVDAPLASSSNASDSSERNASRPLYSIDIPGFRNTTGFSLYMTRNGSVSLKEDPRASCLAPLLDSVAAPQANAFAVKVFSAKAAPSAKQATDEPAVGWFSAKQPKIKSRHTFVAHQVNFLHVSIPSAMVGGELRVQPGFVDHNDTRLTPVNVSAPHTILPPLENKMTTLRGDSFMRIDGFSTGEASGSYMGFSVPNTNVQTAYMAVVIEQYLIPERMLSYAAEFALLSEKEMFEQDEWPAMKAMIVIACSVAVVMHICNHAFALRLGKIKMLVVSFALTSLLHMAMNWGAE